MHALGRVRKGKMPWCTPQGGRRGQNAAVHTLRGSERAGCCSACPGGVGDSRTQLCTSGGGVAVAERAGPSRANPCPAGRIVEGRMLRCTPGGGQRGQDPAVHMPHAKVFREGRTWLYTSRRGASRRGQNAAVHAPGGRRGQDAVVHTLAGTREGRMPWCMPWGVMAGPGPHHEVDAAVLLAEVLHQLLKPVLFLADLRCSPRGVTAVGSVPPVGTASCEPVSPAREPAQEERGLTSLKLSKAARMISCPPRTRHTAASSSSTSALVLGARGLSVLVPARGGGGRPRAPCPCPCQTEGWTQPHLGFLLLRLRAISFTACG